MLLLTLKLIQLLLVHLVIIKEFRCYLIKSGTILEGEQSPLSIESDRNILSKQDVMSVDYHSAYHIMGTKWTSATDNPTNAQLANSSNWAATYDVDLIPIVELIVNSPLDTQLFLNSIKLWSKTSSIIGGVFSLRYNKTKLLYQSWQLL
ncbi:MAG: hypothetical protein CM15mV142_620 [Caudoviricetes sp.]|nr:MAG: hypothetical protein CM15mV142_620 [Caudoviricetes sp.]